MMRAHAIVIGVDQYPKEEWNLSGAVRDAVKFAQWAIKDGGVAPADLTLLLSPLTSDPPIDDAVLAPLAQPASREAISKTLNAYRKGAGKNADRLWFYYAGHGLAPPGSAPDAGPLMVPADTEDLDDYVNDAPLGLEKFRGQMQDVAPREQFYFIDACRDVLTLPGNKILTQQLLWDVRGVDDDALATQAIFLGTTAGQRAKELRGEGLFGRALIAALRGLGPELLPPLSPAPIPRRRLLFDQLVKFVREAVKRSLDELPDADNAARKSIPYARVTRATGDITIAEFEPSAIPRAKIGAIVSPASARNAARIEFLQWNDDEGQWMPRKANPAPAMPPLPEVATFDVRGGSHYVRVEAAGFETSDREILVYEDKRIPIKLKAAPQPGPGAPMSSVFGAAPRVTGGALESLQEESVPGKPPAGSILVMTPDRLTALAVYDGAGKERGRAYGRLEIGDLMPGPYKVTAELTSSDRVERTITVRSGATETVELHVAAPALSPVVHQVLVENGIPINGPYTHPSENFGNVADLRLASLLAYGAWGTRWPQAMGFHHMRDLGVDPLPGLAADGCALQVLLGVASQDLESLKQCRAQTDREELELTRLPRLAHAVQGSAIRPPGPARVRVEMPGFAAASFSVTLLPRFVTVLVVSREEDGDVEVQQHLNPIDPMAVLIPGCEPPRPDDVRLVEIATRALENRDAVHSAEFRGLIAGKRSNPMLAVIAGYRMFGTDRASEFRGPLDAPAPPLAVGGPSPLWNIVNFFDGLPDVHILAGLYDPERRDEHFARAMQRGTPVLAEGFWTLMQWMTERAIARDLPPPALNESVLPGIAWTAFSEPSRAARVDALRIVTASGQTRFGDAARDDVITTAARAVGLLTASGGIGRGSAFLIAPRVIVCPIYLATVFAVEEGNGSWRMNDEARVQFDPHDANSARTVARVLTTIRPQVAPDNERGVPEGLLDQCWPVLLELAEDAPCAPLQLAEAPAEAGQPVAVIGFPHRDIRHENDDFAQHFAGSSGEKHVMWGAVVRAADQGWTFDDDCFTSVGTGGGPVIDLDSGAVVGMHVAALPPSQNRKRGIAIAMTRFAEALRAALAGV